MEITNVKLNWLKQRARKISYAGIMSFDKFFENNNLAYVDKMGQVIEIMFAWILGSIQEELHEQGIHCVVYCDKTLDRFKIDFEINHAAIQVKFDHSDADIESLQDVLRTSNIHVINIKKYNKKDFSYTIQDSIIEILKLAGLNQEEIDDFLGSSDAIFAAEEIWVKYTASWEERR